MIESHPQTSTIVLFICVPPLVEESRPKKIRADEKNPLLLCSEQNHPKKQSSFLENIKKYCYLKNESFIIFTHKLRSPAARDRVRARFKEIL